MKYYWIFIQWNQYDSVIILINQIIFNRQNMPSNYKNKYFFLTYFPSHFLNSPNPPTPSQTNYNKDIIHSLINYNMTLRQHWKTKQRQALSGAIKTKGYLLKRSNSLLGNYQKRFFIINNDYLVYYEDESLDDLKNKLSLTAINDIKPVGELQFTFFYKEKNKKYQIRAESKEQRDQWVSSLIVIEEYLSTASRKTLTEAKQPGQETKFETTMRATLSALSLEQLAKQYHEDYIKCRVIGHLTTKGCLFLVSCKSLVRSIKDEIILDKEYVYPKEFNVLYLHDPKTNTCEKVINSEEIEEIVLTARTLRINNIMLNLQEEKDTSFTLNFIERLRNSISIAREYRNKKGIILRQNVDYLVELFHKQSDRLQKQHIQIKLQDEYISIMVNNIKDYKKNFNKFKALIKHLRTQIQDTLNAIELKEENLSELSILYVNFYYDKIYKLLKLFWTENYDAMKISEIISLMMISLNFNSTVSKYVSDGSLLLNGAKLLRDIYLKKILTEIEEALRELIKREEVFSVKNSTTVLPGEFVRIVKEKYQVVEENCECEETRRESEKLLVQAATLSLINQLENKLTLRKFGKELLVIICNDTFKHVNNLQESFSHLDTSEASQYLAKFQSSIVKKLYTSYLSQQQTQYSIIEIQFLKVSVEKYVLYANKHLNQLQNLSPESYSLILNRMAENFSTFYFRSLLSSCSKTVVFRSAIEEMVEKIRGDCGVVRSTFSKGNAQKIEALMGGLIELLEGEDISDERIRQIYAGLVSIIISEEFRQNDIITLLKLKNTRSKQQLDHIVSLLASTEEQIQQQQQLANIELNISKISSSLSNQTTQPPHQITQAQLLFNNDINLEGYLKRKKTQIQNLSGGYTQQYFKLTSSCLLWYSNPGSTTLVDRIFLSDIKEVYLHPKAPSKFYIDLKNGIRHKFKTSSIDTAIKWVEHINLSSFKPKTLDTKTLSMQNIPSQQIFSNYFQQIQGEKMQSRFSNMRDYKPSKITTQESSSVSPVKKKTKTPESKKKFGLNKMFGCVSLS